MRFVIHLTMIVANWGARMIRLLNERQRRLFVEIDLFDDDNPARDLTCEHILIGFVNLVDGVACRNQFIEFELFRDV